MKNLIARFGIVAFLLSCIDRKKIIHCCDFKRTGRMTGHMRRICDNARAENTLKQVPGYPKGVQQSRPEHNEHWLFVDYDDNLDHLITCKGWCKR